MFPINVPNETTMKGHAVFHDLVVSPRSAGPCSTLPWSSSGCTAIADSQRRDAILAEEILHLDFLHHLHVPETTKTARTNRQLFVSGKNNSDSNWYKYISFCICTSPPHRQRRLSFVCLFSFWNSRRRCAKVAFVCDDPTERLSWVWSAEIQEVGLLFNPCFLINGDT